MATTVDKSLDQKSCSPGQSAHALCSPGQSAHAHELVDVPDRGQRVVAAGGEVLTARVERDADTVGWMRVQCVLCLHVRVASEQK